MISHDELRQMKLGKEEQARGLATNMVQQHAEEEAMATKQMAQQTGEQVNYEIYNEAQGIVQRIDEMMSQNKDPSPLMQNLPPELQQAVMDIMEKEHPQMDEGMEQPPMDGQPQQEQPLVDFNIPNDTIPSSGEVIAPANESENNGASTFDMSGI